MGYILNQFNQGVEDYKDTVQSDYLTPIRLATAKQIDTPVNFNVSNLDSSNIRFKDEILVFDTPLEQNKHYYFHARILKKNSVQDFDLFLCNNISNNSRNELSNKKQFLRHLTISSGQVEETKEWVDFEIIFTPYIDSNCLYFRMNRDWADFTLENEFNNNTSNIIHGRVAIIAYLEVSEIKNMMDTKLNLKVDNEILEIAKFGIQSRPGLMLCVNGEEIRVGRTGTYEMRNGIITTTFLSSVTPAIENCESTLIDKKTEMWYCDNSGIPTEAIMIPGGEDENGESQDVGAASLDILLNYIATTTKQSKNLINTYKARPCNGFTLDYMYYKEE